MGNIMTAQSDILSQMSNLLHVHWLYAYITRNLINIVLLFFYDI